MSAPPHAGPPSLAVGSLNVNGLGRADKRRSLFRQLQAGEYKLDVLLVQETHHPSPQVAAEWVHGGAGPGLPFRGPSLWAAGTSASRGAAVLVAHRLGAEKFEAVHQCAQGRIAGALLTLPGPQQFLFFSVYAPAVGAERAAFFLGPLREALLDGQRRHPAARLIVGGDFNCIESLTLDQMGGGTSTSRLVGFADGLLPVQVQMGLVDSYRNCHPSRPAFTHLATSRITAARLDRVLIADALVPFLTGAGVDDGEGDAGGAGVLAVDAEDEAEEPDHHERDDEGEGDRGFVAEEMCEVFADEDEHGMHRRREGERERESERGRGSGRERERGRERGRKDQGLMIKVS